MRIFQALPHRARMVDPPDLRLYLTALGRQLRQVRKAQRLGTEALAARTGMAAQNVRAIEAGQRNVTMGTPLRFAEALNVPMLALLPEESHEPVGLREIVDGVWQVSFASVDIGLYDHRRSVFGRYSDVIAVQDTE